MPKIVIYQTTPVWFVNNEYFMAKIDVYRSLLPSDHVIGWDRKVMSHPNSNASFINIWGRLSWWRSPNLTRSSKLAAAPNCWAGAVLDSFQWEDKKEIDMQTCIQTHEDELHSARASMIDSISSTMFKSQLSEEENMVQHYKIREMTMLWLTWNIYEFFNSL